MNNLWKSSLLETKVKYIPRKSNYANFLLRFLNFLQFKIKVYENLRRKKYFIVVTFVHKLIYRCSEENMYFLCVFHRAWYTFAKSIYLNSFVNGFSEIIYKSPCHRGIVKKICTLFKYFLSTTLPYLSRYLYLW